MNEDVLNQILNETNTPNEAPKNDPIQSIVDEVSNDSNGSESKPKVEKNYDPDMVWDDESNVDDQGDDGEPENRAPDQQDDAELAAIEEKNKWMKGRLAPVKEKLSKAEEELARLRAENEQLKAGKPAEKAPEVQSQAPATLDEFIESQPTVQALTAKLKELEANAENMTQGDYIDQRLEILSELKIEKREIASAIKAQQNAQVRAVAQAEEKIATDYKTAVMSKKEEYPEIDKAFNRIEKNAQHLDINIRGMLVFEGDKINPMAAELVNIIGNDKDALGYLIAQSKLAQKSGRPPVQAIEYLGRLKARIQSERESAETMQAPDIDVQLSRRKPGLPKEVRNSSTEGESKDLQRWARDAIKAGKRPW